MAAIVITVTNIMFYATNHSTELSPFGREEPKVPGAVCSLILPNDPRRKDFFPWSNFSKHSMSPLTMGKELYQKLLGEGHF